MAVDCRRGSTFSDCDTQRLVAVVLEGARRHGRPYAYLHPALSYKVSHDGSLVPQQAITRRIAAAKS